MSIEEDEGDKGRGSAGMRKKLRIVERFYPISVVS